MRKFKWLKKVKINRKINYLYDLNSNQNSPDAKAFSLSLGLNMGRYFLLTLEKVRKWSKFLCRFTLYRIVFQDSFLCNLNVKEHIMEIFKNKKRLRKRNKLKFIIIKWIKVKRGGIVTEIFHENWKQWPSYSSIRKGEFCYG